MAFTAYHNINGANGVNVELTKPGDNTSGIKSILVTNTDTATVTVDLFIQDEPPSGTATSTFYIVKGISIPVGVSFLLDDEPALSFSGAKYGLYITVGSSDTVDVLINI